MLFRMAVLGSILCLAAASALADEAADRAKLAGKWQPKASEKSDYGTWTLEDNTGVERPEDRGLRM
jgi:invasion protein IalB